MGRFPTKIKLPASPGFSVTGDFKPVPPPAVHKYPEIYKDLPVEEHAGRVTWYAPIELASGVDPRQLKIEGKLNVQVCSENSCLPPKDYAFTATLGTVPQLPEPPKAEEKPQANRGTAAGFYENPRAHARISGHLQPKAATPGQTVQLMLTAVPAEQWHVYALGEKAPPIGSKPTLIVFSDLPSGWKASTPRTSSAPMAKEGDQPYHEQPVTWTVDLTVPTDAAPGPHRLAGLMGYQTCWTNSCDLPTAARFEGTIQVAQQAEAGATPLSFSDARYAEAAKLADHKMSLTGPVVAESDLNTTQPDQRSVEKTAKKLGLPTMLLWGFLGGVLLNLMPCVFPVIGLKVLSFVEQAGESRGRVLMLNIWYSLGLLSVFLVLATLAVLLGLGWGHLFQLPEFKIALACVVFVFALSFLGIWEIPIPGFVGSGKAQELAYKEGPTGAFLKGALTTVLATPCTGPFMGPALGWALQQPPTITYSVFASVGLGMASPYLLIGAFPRLMTFLPRPAPGWRRSSN